MSGGSLRGIRQQDPSRELGMRVNVGHSEILKIDMITAVGA